MCVSSVRISTYVLIREFVSVDGLAASAILVCELICFFFGGGVRFIQSHIDMYMYIRRSESHCRMSVSSIQITIVLSFLCIGVSFE